MRIISLARRRSLRQWLAAGGRRVEEPGGRIGRCVEGLLATANVQRRNPTCCWFYNVALIISDGITARVGSLTANKERFITWNTIKNEDVRPLLEYQLEKVVRGFFHPEQFPDCMQYFVLFEDDGEERSAIFDLS